MRKESKLKKDLEEKIKLYLKKQNERIDNERKKRDKL